MALGAASSVLVVFRPVDVITDIVYSALGGIVVVLREREYFRAFSKKPSWQVFRDPSEWLAAERTNTPRAELPQRSSITACKIQRMGAVCRSLE